MDDVTFEVMRHRLWEINNEIGVLAARMAASPAVYETGDYNTGILDRHGRGVFSGVGVIRMATALDLVVASVREVFGDDIGPGDVFLTNDPFAGALHAMDVAVVAPVFVGDTLVSWTGIVFHELDMGGPTPGSWSVGARDAYQEPPLVPPVRVVHGDVVRHDVEAAFLRNSRAPDVLAINLHAKMGAQELARARIQEVVAEIGVEEYLVLLDRILDDVRVAVREQLREVPDGRWTASTYIDHDGVDPVVHELRLTADKRGDRLTLDFTGTSPQARGPVNCARSGLVAGVLEVLVPAFCVDLPWSHGAVAECVEIISEPGTVNNAVHPAPTSMATVNGCQSTSDVVWQVLAMMRGWVPERVEETIAVGYGGVNSAVSSGRLADGSPFVMSCSGLGGGAARHGGDGVDSGGNIIAPIFAIPNVERLESLSPLLWLWRRELPDSGGPGRWRGGLGVEFAVAVRAPVEEVTVVAFSTSWAVPAARGAHGGFPGGMQSNVVVTGRPVVDQLLAEDPHQPWAGAAEATRVLNGKVEFTLRPDEVWVSAGSGGGGFGDPRSRPVEAVLADVVAGNCSPEHALLLYGVRVAEGEDGGGLVATRDAELPPVGPGDGDALLRGPFFDHLGGDRYACRRCAARFAAGGTTARVLAFGDAAPVSRWATDEGYDLLVTACPDCDATFRVDVRKRDADLGDTGEWLA